MPRKKPLTAINILREMDSNHRRIKYPNARYYYHDDKLKDNSANGIMKCIEKYHSIIGGVAERIHTQGRRVDNTKIVTDVLGFSKQIGSVEWRKTTGRKGTSDMKVLYNGLAYSVEIKYGRDTQKDDQIDYQKAVEAAGGIYIIVKSFEDYLIWFKSKFGRHYLVTNAIDSLTCKFEKQ